MRVAVARARRLSPGLWAFTAIWMIAIGAVLWGVFVANPQVSVREFDAGPVDERFAIGRVVPFPEVNVYVVGLEDGRVRALDGIVRSTGCSVQWRPDDERGRAANPRTAAGVFHDPCSGQYWAATGDALDGDEPLRTFRRFPVVNEVDGLDHLIIEVIGRAEPAPDS